MPKDDTPSRASMTQNAGGPPAASWTQQQQSSIFRIPAPLKRVFDKFPLVQYDENELPLRATKDKSQHVLHVFTTDKDAREGKPSFNPGCLKWQVWTMDNGQTRRIGGRLNDILLGLSQLLWCRIQTGAIEQSWIALGRPTIPTACSHREGPVQCAERGNDEQA